MLEILFNQSFLCSLEEAFFRKNPFRHHFCLQLTVPGTRYYTLMICDIKSFTTAPFNDPTMLKSHLYLTVTFNCCEDKVEAAGNARSFSPPHKCSMYFREKRASVPHPSCVFFFMHVDLQMTFELPRST